MTQAAPTICGAAALVADIIFIKRPTFCSVELFKEIKSLKKSRVTKVPFAGKIEKREQFTQIGLASDYGDAVNRHRQAHATEAGEETYEVFEAEPLPWGQWLPGSRTVIEHMPQGKTEKELYIRFYKHDNTKCKVTWYLDGVEVDKATLVEWLPSDELDTTADKIIGSERQDLPVAERVKPFGPAMRNIVRMAVNGKEYLPFA